MWRVVVGGQVGVQGGRGFEAAQADLVDLLVAPGQLGEGVLHAAAGSHRGDGVIDDRESEPARAQDGDEVRGALFVQP